MIVIKKTKKEKRLREGEIRILETLAKRPPNSGLTFMKLSDEADLSNPVLSEYLKNLQKKCYVYRDIDSRNYRINKEGRKQLAKVKNVENIEFSSVPFAKNVSVDFMSKSIPLDASSWQLPFTETVANVNGYLFVDKFSPNQVTSIAEKLELQDSAFIYQLFADLQTAVLEAIGINPNDNGFLRSLSKPEYQKMVNRERAGLEYYAAIMLVFDGYELSKKINWEKLLVKASAAEQNEERWQAKFRDRIINDPGYRKNWLQKALLDSILFLQAKHARSEKELEEELVRMVVKNYGNVLGDSAETEVREAFDDFRSSRLCSIIPEYFVKVDSERAASIRENLARLNADLTKA